MTAPILPQNSMQLPIPPHLMDRGKQVPTVAPVEHYVLSASGDGPKVMFGWAKVDLAGQELDITAYALKVAQENASGAVEARLWATKGASTSRLPGIVYAFTFEPGHHVRWVMVELASGTDWQFIPGAYGVTSKALYDQENHGLCFAVPSRIVAPTDDFSAVAPGGPDDGSERCKVLYWGISKRPPETAREFNFYVQFYQFDEAGFERTVPTILDPDVPNTGGSTIP